MTRRSPAALPRRRPRGRGISGARRIGLRPEKCASGACLTMPPRLGFAVHLARIRVSLEVVRATVAKPCLGGWDRLQRTFRTDAAGWPNRAAHLTCPCRTACTSPGTVAGTRRPRAARQRLARRSASAKAGQLVNRSASVPIGGGVVSPLTEELSIHPNDCWLSVARHQPPTNRKQIAGGSIYRASDMGVVSTPSCRATPRGARRLRLPLRP